MDTRKKKQTKKSESRMKMPGWSTQGGECMADPPQVLLTILGRQHALQINVFTSGKGLSSFGGIGTLYVLADRPWRS